jgi:hypothetical protein
LCHNNHLQGRRSCPTCYKTLRIWIHVTRKQLCCKIHATLWWSIYSSPCTLWNIHIYARLTELAQDLS